MGSVSKLFTDTAAMQPLARGRLALAAAPWTGPGGPSWCRGWTGSRCWWATASHWWRSPCLLQDLLWSEVMIRCGGSRRSTRSSAAAPGCVCSWRW